MYFKKLLLSMGLLTIAAPSSLSVVSCNFISTRSIISDIDSINDLEIFISSEEENETIFNILNNPNFGIATAIANHKDIDKVFKKELFKLDLENLYFDSSRITRITDKDKIQDDTTYYFQYSYKNKSNTTLIPVKIRIDDGTRVIRNIDKISDLEIAISLDDENKTIFNILNDSNLGIAEVISKREEVANDFKKELFKLDLENLYFDSSRITRITDKEKITIDSIYYFQYSYNNTKNTTLVPITIKNDEETSLIKSIDKISDLEIAISLDDENKTVFDILNDSNLGIAEVISKREEVANDFKKELFKLDLENIYLDKNKNEKINQEQKVIIDTTYYFQYSYNHQKNNVLVAITIKNDEETVITRNIVKNINSSNYSQKVENIITTVDDLKAKIDAEFIKSKLNNNLKKHFDNNLFKLHSFKGLTDSDLIEIGTKDCKIVYSYGLISNQETNLTLDIIKNDQAVRDEISKSGWMLYVKRGFTVEEMFDLYLKNFNWMKEHTSWHIQWDRYKLIKVFNLNTNDEINDSDFNQEAHTVINTQVFVKYGEEIISFALKFEISS